MQLQVAPNEVTMATTHHRTPISSTLHHQRRCVLIVESNRAQLVETAAALRSVGYRVAEASDFNEGNRILSSEPPDLLIAGIKLGAYNGLHLIARAHAKYPDLASIVTSDAADPVLEAEARRQNATYVSTPWQDPDFLQAITRSLDSNVA